MSATSRLFGTLAAVLLAAATALGAYTSHGMEGVLTAHAQAMVGTAVQYQFLHGLGLLIVALLADRLPGRATQIAGWLMLVGTLLFCCGIYGHYLLGFAAVAPITPFGGGTMIASWLVLAFAFVRNR